MTKSQQRIALFCLEAMDQVAISTPSRIQLLKDLAANTADESWALIFLQHADKLAHTADDTRQLSLLLADARSKK